jgi:tyrosine-protein phosphatase YwqE
MIKKGMGLEVEVASEYYLDEQFERLLQDRELLSFGRKHILFEMSYTHEPKNLFDLVIEMQLAGYKPVLAHPERYHFMNKDHEIYHRLKEAKVLFQVNLLSFTDYYSKTIQKNALWLSNEKMIDFLGSDVHKMKHIDNIEVLKSKNILQNVIRENSLKNKFL